MIEILVNNQPVRRRLLLRAQVAFNEDAFRRLVMPPERKRLIEALVLSHADKGTGAGQRFPMQRKGGTGSEHINQPLNL
jgi:hypothetical protein